MAYLFNLKDHLKQEYDYIDNYHAQVVGYSISDDMINFLNEYSISYFIEFYHYEKGGWTDFLLFVSQEQDSVLLSMTFAEEIEYLGVVPY